MLKVHPVIKLPQTRRTDRAYLYDVSFTRALYQTFKSRNAVAFTFKVFRRRTYRLRRCAVFFSDDSLKKRLPKILSCCRHGTIASSMISSHIVDVMDYQWPNELGSYKEAQYALAEENVRKALLITAAMLACYCC